MIDLTKPLRTKGGNSVRIICTDAKGQPNAYSIIALVKAKESDDEAVWLFWEDGSRPEPELCLENIPKETYEWINYYSGEAAYLHRSKDGAIMGSAGKSGTYALIKVVKLDGKVVRVELEK